MPARVGAARGARVLETGALLDRQRVHVGAQPDDRALSPVADDGDHSGLADALFELDAEVGEVAGDDPGRAGLLERQFRMPVQVDVEAFEVDRHAPEPTEELVGALRSRIASRRRATHHEVVSQGARLGARDAGIHRLDLGEDRLGRALALPERKLVDRGQPEELAELVTVDADRPRASSGTR